jgi:hypothetical protein
VAISIKEESRKLTLRQREGRAINAVAELLRRTLSVPNIYLEPPAAVIDADVLAVDRAGAGDLHAVEIKLIGAGQALTPRTRLLQIIASVYRRVMSAPAHFRYLALPASHLDVLHGDLSRLGLYAQDGIGRLGIIAITENGVQSPTAQMVFTPERFRVDPAKLKAIETKLLAKSRPDIEVRI